MQTTSRGASRISRLNTDSNRSPSRQLAGSPPKSLSERIRNRPDPDVRARSRKRPAVASASGAREPSKLSRGSDSTALALTQLRGQQGHRVRWAVQDDQVSVAQAGVQEGQ